MNMRKLIAVAAVAASAVFPMAVNAEDKAVSGTYRLSADEDWTAYDTVSFTGGTTVDLAGHTLTVNKFGCTGLATTNDIAAGYAGLAHLETDGGQYVVLSDYDPAADDRVEMCARLLEPSPQEQFLFGSRQGVKNRAFNLYLNNNNPRIDYSNQQLSFGQVLNTTDDYTIIMDGKNHGFSVLADGVSIKPAVALPDSSFTAVKPFSLFTVNSSTVRAKVRFYWFRVYGSDGTLKCNVVPAYDKANEVIGVYDLVSGNFYGNSGTGAFTAKGEARIVNAVDGYTRLSYLDTDGNSYASLSNYQIAADDRVEMEVRFLARKNQFLFGSRQGTLNRAFNLYLNNNKPRIDYSNKQPNFATELNTTDDYVVVMDGKNLSFSVNYPGGLAFGTSVAISDPSTFTPVTPFYLFTVNNNGSASTCSNVRFYRFKAYGSDGALKCDAVPAKRASDGAIGVYDRVAKSFHAKSGSGSFTAVGAAESELSNAVDPAEFHVNIPANAVFTNDVVNLVENVRLVKDGGGAFVPMKTPQNYTGGTLVIGGTLACGDIGRLNTLGANDSTVTVSTNGVSVGTLDMNGQLYYANYNFVLDGGCILNSADPSAANLSILPQIGSLSLTADSVFSLQSGAPYGLVRLTKGNAGDFGFDGSGAVLDLGGYTLTFDLGADLYVRGLTTSGGAGGTISVTGSSRMLFYPPLSDMSNATLIMEGATGIRVLGADTSIPTVKDYIVNTTGADDVASGLFGHIVVTGTFQPNTDRFYGCLLKSGATLDLSGRSAPLDVASANNASSSKASVRTVHFEDGATIYVKLGATRPRNPIVRWANEADKPSNWDGLEFRPAQGSVRGSLVKKDDGLYFRTGFMLIVK